MAQVQKKKVLIVDDDPATLELLGFVFTHSGYQVVTGKNGREAVVLAGKERPDLILLDYHMPLMNGFNAAGVIHSCSYIRPRIVGLSLEADSGTSGGERSPLCLIASSC